MGARHAEHFLNRTPRAELVAVFCPSDKPTEIQYAKENLVPWGVKLYTDYDEMLAHEGLEAVCIATVTTVHAEQTIKAIEKEKHVLCEKPLSTSVDVVCLDLSRSKYLKDELIFFFFWWTVPTCPRHRQPKAPPESYVRLLAPLRPLIPRRPRPHRLKHNWSRLHHPLSDVRQARPVRILRPIRAVLGWNLRRLQHPRHRPGAVVFRDADIACRKSRGAQGEERGGVGDYGRGAGFAEVWGCG